MWLLALNLDPSYSYSHLDSTSLESLPARKTALVVRCRRCWRMAGGYLDMTGGGTRAIK